MERAQDPEDALEIYRAQMRHRNAPLQAFEGAGRTAYALGRIATARESLARAVQHPRFEDQNELERRAVRQMLADSARILELYPDPYMNVRGRATRIRTAARIARARLAACYASANAAGEMASLQEQWQQIPANLGVFALERNPQLEQATMDLVYSTEEQTAQVCGASGGDDSLLLKISQAPLVVQQ
jgi:hypothetical protein